VEESILSDGDVIMFADIEFTFVCGGAASSPATRTQVFDAGRNTEELLEDSDAVIREVRRVHEMLTLRNIRTYFQPIVRLDDRQILGYSTIGPGADGSFSSPGPETFLATVECTLIERLHHATRLIAAEESASRFPPDTLLFMDVHSSEIGTDFLIQSIRSVHRLLAGRCQLAVRVPNAVASSTPYFRELHSSLSGLEIRVAFTAFAAGPAQVHEHDLHPPDFVELDPSLVRYVHRNPKQQSPKLAVSWARRSSPPEFAAKKKSKPAGNLDANADKELCTVLPSR
jgi:EAL domain-containing protein (putative c-di-GMP-specific phosphodiesterase class I)